jgi:hypothetical protein
MTRHQRLNLLLMTFLVGCADGPGVDPEDAEALEVGLKDHGPWDSGVADAGGCSGPNPTDPNDSGSFCVHHLGRICLDVTWHHVCVDGVWECPEPGMILTRDCRGFINMHTDLGDLGFVDFDAGEDAGALDDATADGSSEDDLGEGDSGSELDGSLAPEDAAPPD